MQKCEEEGRRGCDKKDGRCTVTRKETDRRKTEHLCRDMESVVLDDKVEERDDGKA